MNTSDKESSSAVMLGLVIVLFTLFVGLVSGTITGYLLASM